MQAPSHKRERRLTPCVSVVTAFGPTLAVYRQTNSSEQRNSGAKSLDDTHM